MEQKWTKVLLLLVLCHKLTSGNPRVVLEGAQEEIHCQPQDMGSMTVIWFRILDSGKSEFIGSYSNGVKKDTEGVPSSKFSDGKIKKNILVLDSFRKDRDSGLYSCGVLVKGKELRFGGVTRLSGERVQQKPTVASKPLTPQPVTTSPTCTCNSPGGTRSSLSCAPLVLGPLVGGCGLLLLLLIITVLYCNRVRTRRCPHHYRRKPRGMPGGNK